MKALKQLYQKRPNSLRIASQLGFCLLFFGLGSRTLSAEIRVLSETAIPYSGFLSKADFDQRFPGKRLENPLDLVSGWYVTYEHLTLRYYFGPILLESIGEDYRKQLETIVASAVEARPDLEDFKIDLRFEPSEQPVSPPETPSDQKSESANQAPPPPPPGLWSFIKRIFGF